MIRFSLLWLLRILLPFSALLILASSGPALQEGIEDGDLGWPKEIAYPGGRMLVYPPQLESLQGDRMTARAALSVTSPGSASPVFGGVWIEARLLTDRNQRTAVPTDVRISAVRFPQAAADLRARLEGTVASEIPKWRMTLSMDHLLAELAMVQEQKAAAQEFRTEPPLIVYRNHPAFLLRFDGEPAWREMAGTSWKRIANSDFFIVQDAAASLCYLHVPPYWWSAGDALGSWQPIDSAPAFAQAAWEREARPELPADATGSPMPERPEIIVVTQPTELVSTNGAPELAAIPGTDLMEVKNSDNDLFLDLQSQFYYVLLSGRWYRKQAGKGEWSFVPLTALPPGFSRIPAGSGKEHVLASVAGTPEARDAVLDAEIPQTAAVRPGLAPELEVTYDGPPQFVSVGDDPVQYAVNSPYAVFVTDGHYYCCWEAVWYEAALPRGPWSVCKAVPHTIYLIPPSCPHYYCTYCHVFGATSDAVYVGYYPGYRGSYVLGSTVVYGTGWTYRPWSGRFWLPRPVTWGAGVRFNLAGNTWNFPLGSRGPCASLGLRRDAATRTPAYAVGIGGCWSGVGTSPTIVDVHQGQRFAAQAHLGTSQNVYAWRPERKAPPHPEQPPLYPVPRNRQFQNNVYTDREGNAYRYAEDRTWERHTPEGWQREPLRAGPGIPHELPYLEPRHPDLDQHHRARTWGETRAEQLRRNAPQRPPPPVRQHPHGDPR